MGRERREGRRGEPRMSGPVTRKKTKGYRIDKKIFPEKRIVIVRRYGFC